MKKILFTACLAASVFAQASLLSFDQGTLNLEGVNLNKSAKVNDDRGVATPMNLELLGAGLRSKTVLFIAAKVYVAQLFSDNKAAFKRDGSALTSLTANSKFVALKISMLRNVSASTLSVSFRDALQANNYVIEGELTQLLTIVEQSADAVQGKSLTMLMSKNSAGGTNIYFEDVTGTQKSFVGSPELMTKVMSIWLGNPADSGLQTLKDSLLKPVY